MINCIYHFLNKPTAASQSSSASSVVSDEALDEESVHSTQNTFAVIERLGDIEAVQLRLDALDVNKVLIKCYYNYIIILICLITDA